MEAAMLVASEASRWSCERLIFLRWTLDVGGGVVVNQKCGRCGLRIGIGVMRRPALAS